MKFVCGTCDYTQLGDTIPSCGQCGTPMHPLALPSPSVVRIDPNLLAAHEAQRVGYVLTGTCLDYFGGLDAVGIPLRSVISLSGGPGIGKTITALRAARGWLEATGGLVRYLSFEEPMGMLKQRAIEHKIYDDLLGHGVTSSAYFPPSPPAPTLIVVDSLQRYRFEGHQTAIPGTARYLLDVVRHFRQVTLAPVPATVLLLGQITKNDTQAGPRAIEHDVDIVARLRRSKGSSKRVLRVTKNRLGPVGDFPT